MAVGTPAKFEMVGLAGAEIIDEEGETEEDAGLDFSMF
jgi:hypothetical protein